MNTFFCHLPYSSQRGIGITASGVRDFFVFPDNPDSETWHLLEQWLSRWNGSWILGVQGFESGFQAIQICPKKKDITQAPQAIWVIPENVQIHAETEKWTENSPIIPVQFTSIESESEYLQALEQIRNHLNLGDIYETNYCTFLTSNPQWEKPYEIWRKLFSINPAPFGGYCQWNEHHLLCLSPERFFQIQGNQLISQPIKGTIKRGADESEDLALKEALHQSPKERNENVMIVDLVRNDLSQIATKGSVKVDELYGIYTFPKLHHMISTVSCHLPEKFNFSSILKSIFPMGSMTGVPKRRAVELMHQFEKSARGWYSGTIGFIEPNGNADFNVIIRSIHYNQKINLAKIGIGSAITLQSDPKAEWKECWLKAQSLIQPLA